ncbi:ATP-binding protein [Nitratifractor sp.]|uniref:ATP-binding protein n=1 Tax=Nitratifractor sp. TaxID=2268144 RepID=UPI0025E8D250|nr:ATP-binding protein [Nitratifractor sp.]
MTQGYVEAKEAFVDEIKVDEYIELEGSIRAYKQLEYSLERSLKMVLLFGKPGTGKTILLHRLYAQHKNKKDLHFIETPTGNRREFYDKLFTIFTGQKMPPNSTISFETFVAYGKKVKDERKIIILLDEAQMYPTEMLEEIRILSDTGSIKFVISLHKTDNEDLMAKKHFQSRIWETIELKNAELSEIRTYIHKRLLNQGLTEVANQLKDRHFKLIYRLTGGNMRECNKLLYTAFEIAEYYDKHHPAKLDYRRFPSKILEMAAIKTGMIHV